MKKLLLLVILIISTLPEASLSAAEPSAPLRIFLRGGPKNHGAAGNTLHDSTVWVKEWLPLLTARGAQVDGAVVSTPPTAEQLENADVLVMFAANAGNIAGEDRANLERFLKRGGGIITFHDAILSSDPLWFKTIVGGAWDIGRPVLKAPRYFEGTNTLHIVNPEHPITQGASSFTIRDEIYWNLHLMPNIQVLMASMQPYRPPRGAEPPPEPPVQNLIPQMWVYENQLEGGKPYRAFVSILGHEFPTYAAPHVRGLLFRAIAWVGHREADLLCTPEEIAGLK